MDESSKYILNINHKYNFVLEEIRNKAPEDMTYISSLRTIQVEAKQITDSIKQRHLIDKYVGKLQHGQNHADLADAVVSLGHVISHIEDRVPLEFQNHRSICNQLQSAEQKLSTKNYNRIIKFVRTLSHDRHYMAAVAQAKADQHLVKSAILVDTWKRNIMQNLENDHDNFARIAVLANLNHEIIVMAGGPNNLNSAYVYAPAMAKNVNADSTVSAVKRMIHEIIGLL